MHRHLIGAFVCARVTLEQVCWAPVASYITVYAEGEEEVYMEIRSKLDNDLMKALDKLEELCLRCKIPMFQQESYVALLA